MSFVYFVQYGDRIKVGYSKNPKGRLQTLKSSNGGEMIPIAVLPGTRQQEKLIHERFREYSICGEWYHDCAEIRRQIEEYRVEGLPSVRAKERRPIVEPSPPQKVRPVDEIDLHRLPIAEARQNYLKVVNRALSELLEEIKYRESNGVDATVLRCRAQAIMAANRI